MYVEIKTVCLVFSDSLYVETRDRLHSQRSSDTLKCNVATLQYRVYIKGKKVIIYTMNYDIKLLGCDTHVEGLTHVSQESGWFWKCHMPVYSMSCQCWRDLT